LSTIICPIIAIQTAAALAIIAAVAPRFMPSTTAPAVKPMISDLPHDELRHQAEAHPVMGARDAVLRVGDDESGQGEAADIERHDGVRVDPRREDCHDSRRATAPLSLEAANVIQRLPERKPRSIESSPLARYSGMIFCAGRRIPKSSTLPSSSTQVQT
jgi:hypothetical protein